MTYYISWCVNLSLALTLLGRITTVSSVCDLLCSWFDEEPTEAAQLVEVIVSELTECGDYLDAVDEMEPRQLAVTMTLRCVRTPLVASFQ